MVKTNFPKLLALLFVLFAANSFTFAQAQGYNWDACGDPGVAKEKFIVFTDAAKAKDYAGALETFNWVYANCPKVHKSLYQHGENMYKALIAAEKDPAKQKEYQDKLLKLYDDRIAYFGEEKDVLQRKGAVAYSYLIGRNDDKALDLLDNLYSKIIELSGKETPKSNFSLYFDVVCKKNKKGIYTQEKVIQVYDQLSAMVDEHLESAQEADKKGWTETEEALDKLYEAAIPCDCQFAKTVLNEKYQANKDVVSAKKIFKCLVKNKCIDDPLFMEVAITIFQKEPSFGLGEVIAKQMYAKGEEEKAFEWYNKIADMPDVEPAKKADTYINMAKLYAKKGSKGKARELAQKAVGVDASKKGEAYSLVAQLYMNSANDCKGNPVEQRYCFLAAYDMYAAAGNMEGMRNAQAQFPSKTDIFTFASDKEGKEVGLNCWIGGSTVLRAKPKQ